MKTIKIKTPAKINLTLEVLNKRPDGYHNIKSIMQMIDLYDFLTFEVSKGVGINIVLSGNSNQIPYDEKNLVYKAALKFFEKSRINNVTIKIYIEKNIPISAGLAGGSTNAAGTIYALNKLFEECLNKEKCNDLCASLGSDINFCLNGGCAMCTSRGEIIEPLPVFIQKVSLIKPKNFGISTKEAYTKFSLLKDKSVPNNTEKLKVLLLKGQFDEKLLYNSLENALLNDYKILRKIKENQKGALMTGSGSTFFVLNQNVDCSFDKDNYEIFENLNTLPVGISENVF